MAQTSAAPCLLEQHLTAAQQVSGRKTREDDPCVLLSNLPADASEGTVRQLFEEEGIQVASIQLLQKGSFNRRRNSGLAYLRLGSAADVERSCQLLDGRMVAPGADTTAAAGRPLIVRKDKFEADQPGYRAAANDMLQG